MNEAACGKRIDGNLVGPATIRESPGAGATAGGAGNGNRTDETRALSEMFNYLAHLVTKALRLINSASDCWRNSAPRSSVPSLTEDSQIGADLRVCADEKDRTDIDQRC
jgi:hypothetical protein